MGVQISNCTESKIRGFFFIFSQFVPNFRFFSPSRPHAFGVTGVAVRRGAAIRHDVGCAQVFDDTLLLRLSLGVIKHKAEAATKLQEKG